MLRAKRGWGRSIGGQPQKELASTCRISGEVMRAGVQQTISGQASLSGPQATASARLSPPANNTTPQMMAHFRHRKPPNLIIILYINL